MRTLINAVKKLLRSKRTKQCPHCFGNGGFMYRRDFSVCYLCDGEGRVSC